MLGLILTGSKPLVYFKYVSSSMILWYMILKVKVLLDKGESRRYCMCRCLCMCRVYMYVVYIWKWSSAHALGASVVWHHSLLLMNSFNKTEAAVFSCRLCFLWAFPFISLIEVSVVLALYIDKNFGLTWTFITRRIKAHTIKSIKQI